VILFAPTSKTYTIFMAMRPVFEWHANT
jgi:hypothetical protein